MGDNLFLDKFKEATRARRDSHLTCNEHPGQKYGPYCETWEDEEEMDSKMEISNIKFGLGSWFMPNWYKYSYERNNLSICTSCRSAFKTANKKGYKACVILAAIMIAVLWYAYSIDERFFHDSGIWLIVIFVMLLVVVFRSVRHIHLRKARVNPRITNNFGD